jgi:hypothetical protein
VTIAAPIASPLPVISSLFLLLLLLELLPTALAVALAASFAWLANVLCDPILFVNVLCPAEALRCCHKPYRCGIVCRCDRIQARQIHVLRRSGEEKALRVDIMFIPWSAESKHCRVDGPQTEMQKRTTSGNRPLLATNVVVRHFSMKAQRESDPGRHTPVGLRRASTLPNWRHMLMHITQLPCLLFKMFSLMY